MTNRAIVLLLIALFVLCVPAGASEKRRSSSSSINQPHEASDKALESSLELSKLTILEGARSSAKNAFDPSDDKVALIATFRDTSLRYGHVNHMQAPEDTGHAVDDHGRGGDRHDQDPEDVRGRRRRLLGAARRLLRP